ncbi:MAG: hypothetical protein IPM42_15345 [Saprospiraceae bacterium]|nr:hypothetical protein [Saprospiraceae bacterium]
MIFIIVPMISTCIEGQKNIYFNVTISDSPSKGMAQNSVLIDSFTLNSKTTSTIIDLVKSGYVTAHVDTIICISDTCTAYIYKGQKYTIGKVDISPEHQFAIEAAGLKRSRLEGKSPDPTLLSGYMKNLLFHYGNIGYPFAKSRIDSLHFKNERLYGKLVIDKGRVITFDSIRMEGTLQLNYNFLKRYLQIFNDQPYNQERVLQVRKKLNDLAFVKVNAEPGVRFVNNTASLKLNLNAKPANRFDFLIGVLPRISTGGERQWLITGDILMEFNNRFGYGEYVFAQFKRLSPENQEVLLKSDVPYLAGLPIGAHLDFRLFKFGQENIDVFFQTGIQYLYSGANQLKLFWSYRSSRLVEINTEAIKQSGRLPSRLDVVYPGAGAGITIREVDYRFNPSKGYILSFNSLAGFKKIIPNVAITSLPGFENSYDSLSLSSLQGEFSGLAEYYIPVKNWATIKTAINAGFRYNPNEILENEKYRLGGNRLLRGFDEESIFSDRFVFLTTEFRLVFDQNSFLSLPFIDFGYTRVRVNDELKYDQVLGVGMGLNFGTNAGIFNIAFAAGSRLGNSLDFGQMKIHFGYVSLF